MANIINLSKMAISAIMASDIDEDEKGKGTKKHILLANLFPNLFRYIH